jgi:hypothetical protein
MSDTVTREEDLQLHVDESYRRCGVPAEMKWTPDIYSAQEMKKEPPRGVTKFFI